MITTLRTKMLIGFTPLVAIMVVLGLWAIVMFSRLGNNIDVILRENYASVLAAQNMKDSLERMDSGLGFAIGGREARGKKQFEDYRKAFATHLHKEQNNVTLPGEQQLTDELARLFGEYQDLGEKFFRMPAEPAADRTELYFSELLPIFNRIKDRADDVLELNQKNMEEMDTKARDAAAKSIRLMVLALIVAAGVATVIAFVLSQSLLGPIRSVTHATRALARGDLDQVVPASTSDELGELAAAFNTMARTIREYRQSGTARLLRAQKTAQATIDSFPGPVVVVDPTGAIERANPAARSLLRVSSTEVSVPWSPPAALRPTLTAVLRGEPESRPTGLDHAIALRDDGQERFFLPHVLSIRDEQEGLLGAAVVLTDVTKFRLIDQLKSDMVSTVSHELKTPLTSIQMAVHLLLEETVGPLNAKQTELLLAARQDSERLLEMINDLLDLTRIEQGRVKLDLKPVASADLVGAAVERFTAAAQDAGVQLGANVTFGLPPVRADRERIEHVFENLINNALAYTPRGGKVHITAGPANGSVQFVVTDTGPGIGPEHLPRVFEKFYRVPGSVSHQGVGLGLAIAREIVVAHGGTISVASQVGQGTTFTFCIPIVPHSDGGNDTPNEADRLS